MPGHWVSCDGDNISFLPSARLPRGEYVATLEKSLIIANDTKWRMGGELMLMRYEIFHVSGEPTGHFEFCIMQNPQRSAT